MLRLLTLIFALWMVGPTVTLAQQTTSTQVSAGSEALVPDYTAWEVVATRAEDAIAAGRASNAAFDQLRSELVSWRSRFLSAQGINSARIETLRDQIEALGDPPADGQTEPQEITDRRAALNDQLSRLQAPVLTAEEAYRRADGLIGEIDALIRDRQTAEILELGPSPLNPVHWTAGLNALRGTALSLWAETRFDLGNTVRLTQLRNNLPLIILCLAIAGVLLLRGRMWMERLVERLTRGHATRLRLIVGLPASLGQIALPFAGLVLVVTAVNLTGLLGTRGTRLIATVPSVGLVFFAARWLGGRVFAKPGLGKCLFDNLPIERQSEGRWLTAGMGLILALAALLRRVGMAEGYSDAAMATLSFPLVVLAAVMLFRMGRLMRQHVLAEPEGEDERKYRNSIIRLIAQVVMALAVVGTLLTAAGYAAAANYLTYPAIHSLALFAFVAVLQRFVTEGYALVMGDPETATDGLIPVLLGFVLAVLAMPVLALIWGARVADLTEVWTRFVEGVSIGDSRISPGDFLTFAAVFVVGYMVTRLVQGGLRTSVLPKTKIDTGGRNAIVSGVGYLGIFLAAVVAITSAGIDLSSLAIVAGALSVGIGFGLQNIVSNFVSGIILLIERPVAEGDWIEVGGVMGTVQSISVRSTRIETFDRTDVIVPNADLVSGTVTNWTKSSMTGRIILNIGVAYGTDTERVQAILQEIAEDHPLVIVNPPPLVTFMGFGADSLDFEVRCVIRDVTQGLPTRSELNHAIARRFTDEGIEIPFAQRDIWLRNPEALRGEALPKREPDAPTQENPEPAPTEDDKPVQRDIDTGDGGDR